MGVQYPLFTHAHHGYGLNDAFDRSVALVVKSSGMAPTADSLRQSQNRQQALQQQVFTPHNPDVMRNLQHGRVDRVGSYEAPSSRSSSSRGLKHNPERRSSASQRWDRSLEQLEQLSYSEDGGQASGRLQATFEERLDARRESLVHPGSSDTMAAEVPGGPEQGSPANALTALEAITGSALVAERQLRADLPVVAHPCLHNGYARTYRRMIAEGELPKPAIVQLIGK